MISNFQWVREKRMSHQKRVHSLSEGYLHPWRMADYHCNLCCIRSVGTGHSDKLPTYQLCIGRLYKEGVWEECWWKKESDSLHYVYYAGISRKRKFQHKSLCTTPLQNPGIVIFCIWQISCTITIDILVSFTKHFLLIQLTSNYWQWNGKATVSIDVDMRRNSVLALNFCSVAPLEHSKGCLQLWVPDLS